ncbi:MULTISPECIES: hypothetical protein [Microcystis]|nr:MULTISPECIES: hypothetical protein [Microcystis]
MLQPNLRSPPTFIYSPHFPTSPPPHFPTSPLPIPSGQKRGKIISLVIR